MTDAAEVIVEETPAPTLDTVAEEVVAAEETETPAGGAETPGEEVAAPIEAGEVAPVDPNEEANRKINNKIARHKREARDNLARAERAERLLDEKAPAPQQTQTAPQEPQIENFETYDDYIVAKAEFSADQRFEQRQKQSQHQAQANAHQQKVNGIINKGNSEHEDFDELTRAIPLSKYALTAATETENGSDVVYFLGKNPAEAERIHALSPAAQMIEMAKISIKLAEPPAPATTKAPAPIDPVSTAGKGDLQYSADMTDAEYAKWRSQHKK